MYLWATVHAVQICFSNKYHFIFYLCIFIDNEGYEKLKAKAGDNEVYITEILEEKTQVEEKKQIITG